MANKEPETPLGKLRKGRFEDGRIGKVETFMKKNEKKGWPYSW